MAVSDFYHSHFYQPTKSCERCFEDATTNPKENVSLLLNHNVVSGADDGIERLLEEDRTTVYLYHFMHSEVMAFKRAR